jgi:hypothetical protein
MAEDEALRLQLDEILPPLRSARIEAERREAKAKEELQNARNSRVMAEQAEIAAPVSIENRRAVIRRQLVAPELALTNVEESRQSCERELTNLQQSIKRYDEATGKFDMFGSPLTRTFSDFDSRQKRVVALARLISSLDEIALASESETDFAKKVTKLAEALPALEMELVRA